MEKLQIVGFALLVGGLLIGAIGWAATGARGEEGEIYGLVWGFLGLMTLLSGGLLLAARSRNH